MKYTKQEIESYLRNHNSLNQLVLMGGDEDFKIAKMDLDASLGKLQRSNKNLHRTLVGVFVLGTPIQEQAKEMNVSKRQINRRLDDGLHMLTMIMNGELL